MIFIALAGIALIVYGFKDTVGEKIETLTTDWTRFDGMFRQWGTIYGVDWTWLKAIALNESDLGRVDSVASGISDPQDTENSVSSDGLSWGLMQVTIKTARGLDSEATEVKLNNPGYSIELAALYISQLQAQFSRADIRWKEWVIKSYNQGPGNTRREIAGNIPGYAQAYWERFQRNLKRVEDSI